jgi:hypothetical protein
MTSDSCLDLVFSNPPSSTEDVADGIKFAMIGLDDEDHEEDMPIPCDAIVEEFPRCDSMIFAGFIDGPRNGSQVLDGNEEIGKRSRSLIRRYLA